MSALMTFLAGLAVGAALGACMLALARHERDARAPRPAGNALPSIPTSGQAARCDCPECLTGKHAELLAGIEQWNRACDGIPAWKWQRGSMSEVKQ